MLNPACPRFHFLCGIPQVTLLGEKSDYEILLSKVKHLDIFSASSHPELDSWRRLLVPIIRRLIDSFDDSTRDIDGFWAHIVHSYDGMCGESFLSGWIGAFGIFDEEGSWSGLPTEGYLDSLRNPNSRFTLDGTEYPMLDATKLPRSWASVPILVNDHGWIYEGKMVAGLVGSRIQVGSEGGHEDTVSPYPAWFMLHSNTTGS